ncbi:MAG: hypothetical protein QM679_01020 [Patulibacter sp.]
MTDRHRARRAWDALQRAGGVVTLGDLADRWQVTRQRASARANTPGFPEPVVTVGKSGIWLSAEVDHWTHEVAHRDGRPGPLPRHAQRAEEQA